jgi:nucleoside-diphosphate-sugar epimerase
MCMADILVTGASSVVGRYLLPLLEAQGHKITALSRRSFKSHGVVTWLRCDISKATLPAAAVNTEILIHVAPLPLLVPLLKNNIFKGLHRVVGVGTTSIFTKSDSGSKQERDMAMNQRRAETELAGTGSRMGIPWTLFRPTLVYDGHNDKNIAKIAGVIRRFGIFPMVKPGYGLRQPLHASDLAWACVAVLDNSITERRAYNLAGGEVLSYREMVGRIFMALGMRPRIILLPAYVYRGMLSVAKILPRFRYLNSEMATRMNRNLVFDFSQARDDFGFSPRSFLAEYSDEPPNFPEDLK